MLNMNLQSSLNGINYLFTDPFKGWLNSIKNNADTKFKLETEIMKKNQKLKEGKPMISFIFAYSLSF